MDDIMQVLGKTPWRADTPAERYTFILDANGARVIESRAPVRGYAMAIVGLANLIGFVEEQFMKLDADDPSKLALRAALGLAEEQSMPASTTFRCNVCQDGGSPPTSQTVVWTCEECGGEWPF